MKVGERVERKCDNMLGTVEQCSCSPFCPLYAVKFTKISGRQLHMTFQELTTDYVPASPFGRKVLQRSTGIFGIVGHHPLSGDYEVISNGGKRLSCNIGGIYETDSFTRPLLEQLFKYVYREDASPVGQLVKQKSTGIHGHVFADRPGYYTVISPTGGVLTGEIGGCTTSSFSLANLEQFFEFPGRKTSGCQHDLRIYDSGWTRESYCTKCSYKLKLV